MNKNILNAIAVGTLAMGLASCGENSWNDHYLDGFEGGVDYESSETATYTLTADDYATISSLIKANAVGNDEIAAAKAIDTNKYFDKNSIYPASVAIPAFLDNVAFPYYLAGNGSTVDVIFNEASSVPAELTALAGAKTYTVTTDDYKAVWESNEDFIKGFAPVKPASASLPGLLAEALPEAVEGNYAVVTYQEASTNPIFNTVDEGPKVYFEETFAEGIGDFTIDNVKLPGTSTYVWKHDTYNGDSYMKASGFVKGCYDSEGWLISPEVTLSAKANAVLVFEQAWKNFKTLENAKQEATVKVREKGGQWQLLTPQSTPENTNYNFYPSGDIDLSAYNGKTIQIGFCYVSTTESAGTWEVKNVKIQEAGAASRSRALAAEVPTEGKNAVYYFNGSKWAVADGVVALNPADYTAMGVNNNKLSAPELYLPIFLKGKLPYAQAGDQEYVVYNGTTTNLYVYDGSVWTLNENGLETVTGRFEKANGVWSFVKYIGKAIFNEFNEQQIELDRSYLFVSGNICGVVIDKNNSYGYILTTSISISGTQYVAPTDANAYLFASSCEIDGKVVAAPEGKFLIRDSYGRYLYLQGTYSSANLAKTPALDENGQIAAGYLWNATNNGDGTWTISNEFNGRTWYYSSKYNNFAAYETRSDVDVLPSLYILAE